MCCWSSSSVFSVTRSNWETAHSAAPKAIAITIIRWCTAKSGSCRICLIKVYLKKPPLHYWILAGAEIVTGKANEWIWRLPSAIGAAALAAMLCVFGNRWFGRPAGIVAGFSHLAMLAIWEQNRAADIDTLNSVAAVLAACCLIDLDYGPVKRRSLMILAAGIAIGATLLLKGPAGMTVVAGALIGPSLMNWNWRRLTRPGPWMAMVIGGAIFGVWVWRADLQQKSQHLPPDTSGLAEAIDKSNIFRHPNATRWRGIAADVVCICACQCRWRFRLHCTGQSGNPRMIHSGGWCGHWSAR